MSYSSDIKSVYKYAKENVTPFITGVLTWLITPLLLVMIYIGDSSALNLLIFLAVIQYILVSLSVIFLVFTLYAIQNRTLEDDSMKKLHESGVKYNMQKLAVKRFFHLSAEVIYSLALAYMGYLFFAFSYMFFMVLFAYIIYKLLDQTMEEAEKIGAEENENE